MNWTVFPWFAFTSILLWVAGCSLLIFSKKIYRVWAHTLLIGGCLFLSLFIILYWLDIERPPLRTQGETRLWYSFFLCWSGFFIYLAIKRTWFLYYALLVAAVFLFINVFKPEIHDKSLMPALQSLWFVPHVTVYILGYALLGGALIAAILFARKNQEEEFHFVDKILRLGFLFLTTGILFGAFWAHEAWGNYWAWDPKEVWALITWVVYLIVIHYRLYAPKKLHNAVILLAIGYILLNICWFGVNYLPTASQSVHTYMQ